MSEAIQSKYGPHILVYRAADNVIVVEVETTDMKENDKGPIMRLYLNEAAVHENPPYSHPDKD